MSGQSSRPKRSKADSEAAARKRFLRDAGFDPKTGKAIEKPTLEVDDDDDDTVEACRCSAAKKDDSQWF
jgi:hypothetical protein